MFKLIRNGSLLTLLQKAQRKEKCQTLIRRSGTTSASHGHHPPQHLEQTWVCIYPKASLFLCSLLGAWGRHHSHTRVKTAAPGLAVDTNPGQTPSMEPCWDPGSSPSALTHHSVCHHAVRSPPWAALSRADLPVNPLPRLPSSFLWDSIQRYSLPQFQPLPLWPCAMNVPAKVTISASTRTLCLHKLVPFPKILLLE